MTNILAGNFLFHITLYLKYFFFQKLIKGTLIEKLNVLQS